MWSNKKKILLLIGIVLVIFVIFTVLTRKTPEEKIIKCIMDIGFIKPDDSTLYYKQVSKINLDQHEENVQNNIDSTYEMLYFNVSNYQLNLKKMEYVEGVATSFSPIYDYTNEKITYNYRIKLNNTNVITEGTYDGNTKDFTCNIIFSHAIDLDNNKTICDKIKLDVEEFRYEAITLITNYELIDYMKKE